ncbi:uncharacterized protein LOC116142839 [Pistacia vera]|uniref:uncharacterized protein LOC116142839 n=1 Tax=Pistacia vera TaxID=55513 RepID=UPI001262E678|nr:uncharacterized protein LOC116142839 [Pistacia vera]
MIRKMSNNRKKEKKTKPLMVISSTRLLNLSYKIRSYHNMDHIFKFKAETTAGGFVKVPKPTESKEERGLFQGKKNPTLFNSYVWICYAALCEEGYGSDISSQFHASL